MSDLATFVPLILVQIIFVALAYPLTTRMQMNAPLWAVLGLIPFIGFLVIYFVSYRFALYILDALNEIKAKLATNN